MMFWWKIRCLLRSACNLHGVPADCSSLLTKWMKPGPFCFGLIFLAVSSSWDVIAVRTLSCVHLYCPSVLSCRIIVCARGWLISHTKRSLGLVLVPTQQGLSGLVVHRTCCGKQTLFCWSYHLDVSPYYFPLPGSFSACQLARLPQPNCNGLPSLLHHVPYLR